MTKYLLIITLLVSGFSFADEEIKHMDVIRCQSYPDEMKIVYYLSDKDIKYPEEMRQIIPALMRLDLTDKIEAISLVLPKDFHKSEGVPYEIRLSEYNESRFARQASCLVNIYKKGDRLYYFAQEPTGSYDEGYVLFRNGKLIAVVVTKGLRI
nr:putative integron gene cassette protein [uncultured bacterium]